MKSLTRFVQRRAYRVVSSVGKTEAIVHLAPDAVVLLPRLPGEQAGGGRGRAQALPDIFNEEEAAAGWRGEEASHRRERARGYKLAAAGGRG